ncbi:unnamed protein product [Allacma fusca]|uniref:CRAL-TRIO domain-containing protein n=1 Tax=Allacma fusca TaxID=39272 RepID=A0A8J2LJL4_9HEXA|nr:unnamed protein product [Allacma fusca]
MELIVLPKISRSLVFYFSVSTLLSIVSSYEGIPEGVPPELVHLYNRGLENWKAPADFHAKFPYYHSGYDEDGKLVWVLELGKWDIQSAMEQGPEIRDLMDKYADQAVLTIYNSTYSKNGITPVLGIVDMDGYSLKQLTSIKTVEFIVLKLRIIVIALTNAQSAYFINTNFVAQSFLNLVKPLLGRQFEKMEVYGTNKATWMAKILKDIPRDQLPSWYGGTEDFKPMTRSYPTPSHFKSLHPWRLKTPVSEVRVQQCQIPELSPDHLQEIEIPNAPECYGDMKSLFKLDFKKNLIRLDPQSKHWKSKLWKQTICYYSPVTRLRDKPDFQYEPETPTRINSTVTVLSQDIDGIHVWCQHIPWNEKLYEDYFSLVQIKSELEEKLHAANGGKEFYSVIIIGQDGSSHMNFIRTMPKVHKFLKEKLGAVEFHGFNSLGPTTLWSMNPFLPDWNSSNSLMPATGMDPLERVVPLFGKSSRNRVTGPPLMRIICARVFSSPWDLDPLSTNPFITTSETSELNS